jgi:O-methyltransferase
MNMIRRFIESVRGSASPPPPSPPEPAPDKIPEPEGTIEVDGVRYTALQVLIQKRALEELVSYRHRTTYELVRLAARFVFRDLRVSDAQLARLSSLTGTPAFQALYILDALNRTKDVRGDVCEYGVAQGRTSALIATTLNQLEGNKRLWLYDSFEGLPKPSTKDVLLHDLYGLGDMAKYEGMFSIPEDLVRAELDRAGFPPDRATICKGWIEASTLPARSPAMISFAYLDMDFYQSTKDVLAVLTERMPAGGIAVADDYDFFSSGVKTAIDEIMTEFPGVFTLERPFEDKFVVLTRR